LPGLFFDIAIDFTGLASWFGFHSLVDEFGKAARRVAAGMSCGRAVLYPGVTGLQRSRFTMIDTNVKGGARARLVRVRALMDRGGLQSKTAAEYSK
jgi:hypothetical protein